MLLEKAINFHACLESQHSPNLCGRQHACTITFDSKRLDRVLREIAPLLSKHACNVFGQFNSYVRVHCALLLLGELLCIIRP